MTKRVVYDTMLFLQWAALPADRTHASIRAVLDGRVRLCMSQALLDEVKDVLSRPAVMARSPNLTPHRLQLIVETTLDHAEWFADVPDAFTWPHHPDDDHSFNLAIAARADRLVTWENRIHDIALNFPLDWARLYALAPQLRIVTPKELAEELRAINP